MNLIRSAPIFRGEVFYEWMPPEIIVEIPVNPRHQPHDMADAILRRDPAPDGQNALVILETVDNTQRGWIDFRLVYRKPPVDTRSRSADKEGVLLRVPKYPIRTLTYGRPWDDELEPEDRFTERLTPIRLGELMMLTPRCTVVLASHPIHVDGLLCFGRWYATGKWVDPSVTVRREVLELN